MAWASLWGVAACLGAVPHTHAAAPPSPNLESLVERVHDLGLAESPTWRALLHYRRASPWSRLQSVVDEPSFFLSDRGARDPAAELDATLRAFFAEPADTTDDTATPPPACRFPARFAWLAETLGVGTGPPRCPRYHAWRRNFDAARLTLVFPEAYMNNPASMFGHTLLRIDSAGVANPNDLLAYAVSFAAHTDGEAGVAYAVKGIFGFYPGYFSVTPYYETVERYGDWENRDIWEYALDFDREEIERVLRHLYELDGVRFDYFFFDENCSYQLLDLLEVGRPGMGLLDPTPEWLIPVDSVRRVREAGLVRDVRFRASAAHRLQVAGRSVSSEHHRLARALSAGSVPPSDPALAALGPEERAAVLSLAYDQLRYRMLAREEDPARTRGRALALLAARSAERGAAAPPLPPRPRVEPDRGHPTRRAAVESGVWNREPYVELRVRPAFHTLMDPEGGYTRGAEIQFMDVALRLLPRRDQVRLQEVRVLEILSLSPRGRTFRPVSWRGATGMATRLIPDGGDLQAAPVWRNRGGAGGMWELRGVQLYGLAEALFEWGGALDGDVALGPGWSLGAVHGDDEDRWRTRVFFSGEQILVGETGRIMSAGVEERLRIGSRLAVSLDAQWIQRFHEDRFEFGLRASVFF